MEQNRGPLNIFFLFFYAGRLVYEVGGMLFFFKQEF